MRVRPVLTPLLATPLLAGCALSPAPGARPAAPAGAATATTTAVDPRIATADRTHELPTPVPRQTVVGGWRTPAQAVTVFATTYINWTAATVAARLRALAEVSIGQARSAMTLAAGETGRDGELQRGGIANAGTVEAVAPVRGHPRQYLVVTRERTTATQTTAYRGLAPTWHVSLATVVPVGHGLWVLSGWQPEN